VTRPRVAWFTPLQPVESGISLYNEELLPILAEVMKIDVYVDGYAPTNLRAVTDLNVLPEKRFKASDYDLIVYQVGNSPAHLYMLPHAERSPGLLVLHDTVLNHLFVQRAAREGKLEGYREEMQRRYGDSGRRAADRVLKGQAPDDLFHFPMSESLVQASLATLVHSEFAREQVLGWTPDAIVMVSPLGIRPPELLERNVARRLLGIPDDQFIVSSVTHINPQKRFDAVLRAFKRLRSNIPARLILAGSISPNFPLARMISHLGLEQVVETPGYVSDDRARIITAASDVIVNLRYPTAGETSGSLLHSMAASRPVLVSDTGSFNETPFDAVIRIPVDELEESMLVAVLENLANDRELGDEIGRNARRFIKQEHSLERWANRYIDAIAQMTGVPIEYPASDQREIQIVASQSSSVTAEPDEVLHSVARDIAELGLGGDDEILSDVATASVELGLGVGMISGSD
jgi:glycosyltransferase involved in cell wall biosynthesis